VACSCECGNGLLWNKTNRCVWRFVNLLLCRRRKPPICYGHILCPSSVRCFSKSCTFPELVIQHATLLRHIAICCLPHLPYFPTLTHKRHDFRKRKVNAHKMCVLILCITLVWNILSVTLVWNILCITLVWNILSVTLVWNLSHSKNNRVRYDQKCMMGLVREGVGYVKTQLSFILSYPILHSNRQRDLADSLCVEFTICTNTVIILCKVYNMHQYYDHTLYSLQYSPILWSYSVQFTICTYTMTILCTVYNMHQYYDHTVYSLQYAAILWSYCVQFTICTYTMIILCTVYNMHQYYDHTLCSSPLYTFLCPEDGPQWPKHVVVSIINRTQDSCVLTYPTPSLIASNTKGMVRLQIGFGRYWRHISKNFNFIRTFSKNYQISDEKKIRPVGAELPHADGRADRQTDTL